MKPNCFEFEVHTCSVIGKQPDEIVSYAFQIPYNHPKSIKQLPHLTLNLFLTMNVRT